MQTFRVISTEQYCPVLQTPLHIHLATEIFITRLLNSANVVVCIYVTLDYLEFGHPSWACVCSFAQSEARKFQIDLNLSADALQDPLIDLIEQHIEFCVRHVQIVAQWLYLAATKSEHCVSPHLP